MRKYSCFLKLYSGISKNNSLFYQISNRTPANAGVRTHKISKYVIFGIMCHHIWFTCLRNVSKICFKSQNSPAHKSLTSCNHVTKIVLFFEYCNNSDFLHFLTSQYNVVKNNTFFKKGELSENIIFLT